jgi:hypothetical protein
MFGVYQLWHRRGHGDLTRQRSCAATLLQDLAAVGPRCCCLPVLLLSYPATPASLLCFHLSVMPPAAGKGRSQKPAKEATPSVAQLLKLKAQEELTITSDSGDSDVFRPGDW